MSISRPMQDGECRTVEALMATPLAVLGRALLAQLVMAGFSKRLQAGQLFQQRDDSIEYLTVVVSGILRIYRMSSEGKIHVVRSIGTGQLLNIVPILDGGPAITDADAVDETELLLIPKAPFLALMDSEPALRDAVHRTIYARSRMLFDELADMALLSLRQRCARVLTSMAYMQHAVGELPASISLVVTQNELSDILGYSRPKVNLELKALQREGLIELGYNCIHIPDLARLADFVRP